MSTRAVDCLQKKIVRSFNASEHYLQTKKEHTHHTYIGEQKKNKSSKQSADKISNCLCEDHSAACSARVALAFLQEDRQ